MTSSPSASNFSDAQLLAFARSALSTPRAALSVLRHLVDDGVVTLSGLGMSEGGLLEIARGVRTYEEEGALERFALSVIAHGSEELNVALTRALGAAGSTIALDENWVEDLWSRPEKIAMLWTESPWFKMSQETVVRGVIERPECFEGAFGVERVKDALIESDRSGPEDAFWIAMGPNASRGALERSVEDHAWERLINVCEGISRALKNPPPRSALEPGSEGEKKARSALLGVAQAAGQLSALSGSPRDGALVLATLAAYEQGEAMEAFAQAADLGKRPFAMSVFVEEGVPMPDTLYIREMRFHSALESSSLASEPIGLTRLGELWGSPLAKEIGSRLGERAESPSSAWLESLTRLSLALDLSRKDPDAADAMAQSAILLWESRGDGPLPERGRSLKI